MTVYVTRTGRFLPGEPVANGDIGRYLGMVAGEDDIRERVLKMNGIVQRHYALRPDQTATHDVYELAVEAVERCFDDGFQGDDGNHVTYLSSGSTHTPYSGPGLSSLLHGMLAKRGILNHPVEVNSNAGICTSSSTALLNAFRAIHSGQHRGAIVVGADRPSQVLKSTQYTGPACPSMEADQERQSKWFMSVFLRFMLSDGAGALVLSDTERSDGLCLRVNWGFSRSFAHDAPVCMTMDNRRMLLSQDIDVLNGHLFRCTRQFIRIAMEQHHEHIDDYDIVLPHLSSFFFRKRMERMLKEFLSSQSASAPPFWTNLATAGNTGAASIFVMLDEFLRTQNVHRGDRILLCIPESGQFNFTMFSLTAC